MRMEDIFKFLLVAGIIVVGIIKQFRKEAQSSEAPPSDEHGMPLPHEANPLPENWGGETYGGYIPEGPKPAEQLHTPKKQQKTSRPEPFIPRRDRQTSSHRISPTSQPTAPPAPAGQETAHTATDFDLQSIEEVRRGILWAEILNRKY